MPKGGIEASHPDGLRRMRLAANDALEWLRAELQRACQGVIRIVLSIEDPGIPNWLDTVGLHKGCIDFRYPLARSQPISSCSLLPLADLRDRLPDGTRAVTAAMRRDRLARRRPILRLWGHVQAGERSSLRMPDNPHRLGGPAKWARSI